MDNSHCDKNFQIEFDNIKELEELKNSLSQMLKYMRMCESDGEELPPLIYKIQEKSKNSKKQ
jgi:uncharacterized protein YdeI (YjbR/CyaY-like superfamily)